MADMGSSSNQPKNPLEMADVEAYIAIAIAIVTVVFEMTWQWKVGLLVILAAMLNDLCWRSKLTIRLYWPLRLILCLTGTVAIIWISYQPMKDLYIAEEFPESRDYINSWGLNAFHIQGHPPVVDSGEASANLSVDGHRLIKRKDRYRLIGICWNHLASQDFTYDTNLSKSGLYEIRDEEILMKIPLTVEFLTEMQTVDVKPSYLLLAVPKEIRADQFSSINEAEQLGAKILSETQSNANLHRTPW
jgi:hypothetical protein